jgi:hypothetical protein
MNFRSIGFRFLLILGVIPFAREVYASFFIQDLSDLSLIVGLAVSIFFNCLWLAFFWQKVSEEMDVA